jgi:hypothetical protein
MPADAKTFTISSLPAKTGELVMFDSLFLLAQVSPEDYRFFYLYIKNLYRLQKLAFHYSNRQLIALAACVSSFL